MNVSIDKHDESGIFQGEGTVSWLLLLIWGIPYPSSVEPEPKKGQGKMPNEDRTDQTDQSDQNKSNSQKVGVIEI